MATESLQNLFGFFFLPASFDKQVVSHETVENLSTDVFEMGMATRR